MTTPLNQAIDATTDAAKGAIDDASDKAIDTVETTRSYATGAVDNAGRKIGGLQEHFEQSVDSLRRRVAEQPVQALLIAATAGVAVGLLRSWRLLALVGLAGVAIERADAVTRSGPLSDTP